MNRFVALTVFAAVFGTGCSGSSGDEESRTRLDSPDGSVGPGAAGSVGGFGTGAGGAGGAGVGGEPASGGTIGSGGLSATGGFPATGGTLATGGDASGGLGGAPPTGGTGGGGVVTPEPTPENASTIGPYDVQSYDGGWADSPDFAGATIWYASNAPTPAPGVSVVPGFTELQLVGWGEFLASHGYIVITVDTNTIFDQPPSRAVAVYGGLETLMGESARADSPIAGKLDSSSLAIMGHSMGGGGTLIAASAHPELKAALPLCPWNTGTSGFDSITVPTAIIAAQSDGIAPAAEHALPFYMSLSQSTTRAYVEMAGANHFVANDPRLNGVVARVGLSWLQYYVRGDARYQPFIADDAAMSQFYYHP